MDPTESENPFASPETVETRDGYLHVYGPERARMPLAVMWVLGYAVAVMAGWSWMAWDAFGGGVEARELAQSGFGVRAFWLNCVVGGCTFLVVLVGVLRRNLLVYRFIRLAVTTLATLLLASSGYVLWQIMSSKAETHATLYLYFAFAVATVVTWSMLYRQSTKVYFGLKCPECGTVRGVQANFLQTRVWCGTCRVTWYWRSELTLATPGPGWKRLDSGFVFPRRSSRLEWLRGSVPCSGRQSRRVDDDSNPLGRQRRRGARA